jgi:small-conductance mechanosensitive channel
MANLQYIPGYPAKTETDTSEPPPAAALEYCEVEGPTVKKDADTSFNPVLLDPAVAREQRIKLLETRIRRQGVADENQRHQISERDKRIGLLTSKREKDKLDIETQKGALEMLQKTIETLQSTNSDLLKKAEESESKITSLNRELTYQLLEKLNYEKVVFLNHVWIQPAKMVEYCQANQLAMNYQPTTPQQKCQMMDWMNTNYARHQYKYYNNHDYVPYQWYR